MRREGGGGRGYLGPGWCSTPMARVEQAAIQARLELWDAAHRARMVLGEPAPLLNPT